MPAKNNSSYSTLRLSVGGEPLYFDVDGLMSHIELPRTTDEGETIVEINVPKFEFFKLMLDTACDILEDVDTNFGVVGLNKLPVSHKMAINTLIKYNIIKK